MDKVRHFSVFFAAGTAPRTEVVWQPRADIYRTPHGWLIKLELAGVRLEDIAVSVSGCRVRVAGVRRDTTMELEVKSICYSMEISYSRFERIIDLPCDLEKTRTAIEYRDGILVVRVATEGERHE